MKIHLPIPSPRTCLAIVGAAVDFAFPPKFVHIAAAERAAADGAADLTNLEAECEVLEPQDDPGAARTPRGGSGSPADVGPPAGVSGHSMHACPICFGPSGGCEHVERLFGYPPVTADQATSALLTSAASQLSNWEAGHYLHNDRRAFLAELVPELQVRAAQFAAHGD